MAKSPDAFRTISEVAEWLDVPTHVLRFWESRFSQVKPVKRAGGRRYYRPADMELLGGIKRLLHDDGMTIRGVQKLLREKGVKHVAGLAPALDGSDAGSSRYVEGNVVSLSRSSSDEVPDRWPFTDDAEEAVETLTSEIESQAESETPALRSVEKSEAVEAAPDSADASDAEAEETETGTEADVTAATGSAPEAEMVPAPEGHDAPEPEGAPAPANGTSREPIHVKVETPPLAIALLSAMGRRGRARRTERFAPAYDRALSLVRALDARD